MNSNFQSSRWYGRALAAVLLVAFFHASAIHAAGLGRINVLSKLGQPFAAEIDLINVSKEELASLKVGLASPTAHQAAGLRFDPVLNALRLSVERRASGAAYIRANSHYRVTEPYLDLLIELNAQDGKFQRGYTALLDLPESAPAVAQAPAQVAAPAPAATPRADVVPAPSRPRVQAAAPAVVAPVAPVAPVVPLAPAVPKPVEPAKVEPPKPAPTVAAPAVAEPVKPETQPEIQEPASAPAPVAETRAPAAPAPKVIAPAPQPGIFDTLKSYLWPIVGLVLAGLGTLWALRRRKPVSAPLAAGAGSAAEATVEPANFDERVAITRDAPAPASPAAIAVTPGEHTVANVTDMVDPMDEARVYLDHGRDEQAEKILREALNKEPGREDIQVVLLEIFAGRGDKNGFNRLARSLHKQTGGQGDHWKRAMAMGYALDPAYALYSSTEGGTLDTSSRVAADLDIDLTSAPDADDNTVDILLSDGSGSDDMDKTMVLTRAGSGESLPTTPAPAIKPLPDMNFELPPASKPHPYDLTVIPPAAPAPASESKLDFEVDFSGIGKPRDDASVVAPVAPASNDQQREAMQQKLDLASAYKEMGDKEAALELLHEVERDGDTAHQAEARKIIQALG